MTSSGWSHIGIVAAGIASFMWNRHRSKKDKEKY